jgi:hypothetical protein
MNIRARRWFLAACCAALAGCAAGPPDGPVATVTAPAAGRPPAPASVEAALSREAFTPYAGLGLYPDDGLAAGESGYSLAAACLAAAGYPGVSASLIPQSIRIGSTNLMLPQPWGPWGYVSTAQAEQQGFRPDGSALQVVGVALPPEDPDSLPAPERTAVVRCATIVADFSASAQSGPLAVITTLTNDIGTDTGNDAAVRAATQRWAACMAGNGYNDGQPQDVFQQELTVMYGSSHSISPASPISAAADQAQTAAAVTDADCSQSADLAGIWFAVQASYEQQLVTANQQALSAAVQRYRAAYRAELTRLPALLHSSKPLSSDTPG